MLLRIIPHIKNYNSADVAEYIKENPFDTDIIYSVNIFNKQGKDIYTTTNEGQFDFDYSHFEWFKYHQEHNDITRFISPLRVGDISHKLLLRISKRINFMVGQLHYQVKLELVQHSLLVYQSNLENVSVVSFFLTMINIII